MKSSRSDMDLFSYIGWKLLIVYNVAFAFLVYKCATDLPVQMIVEHPIGMLFACAIGAFVSLPLYCCMIAGCQKVIDYMNERRG